MRSVTYEFDRLDFGHAGGYIFQSVCKRRLTAVYHAHDFFELVWVREGSAVQMVNGADLTFAAGEALLLRPGEAHRFNEQSEDLAVISLSFTREELEVMAGAFSPMLYSHILRAEGPITLTLDTPYGEVVGNTAYDCKYLLSFFLRSYIAAFGLADAGAELPPSLAALTAMREPENLREGIGAALRLSHYSQSHLARLVRAHYGMGLKAWINELRLQAAYRELILSDRSIAALADAVGFASPAHFCRIFRARYGVSPAALRKSRAIHTV